MNEGISEIAVANAAYAAPTRRAAALADRLEQGARALAALAASLSDDEWRSAVPGDGRSVGVVVHHVANVYPIEVELAYSIARGVPIRGVTMATVDEINAAHAADYATVTRDVAVALLLRNSSAAAAAIRALTDSELDRAAPASLYADAPVTCQFVLEDHAVRHSYHHLARIRAALGQFAIEP
jgi:hypothetical protein